MSLIFSSVRFLFIIMNSSSVDHLNDDYIWKNHFEITSKLFQCFILHVTTSETEISAAEIISKLYQGHWTSWKYSRAAISFWNNFEIILGKFWCAEIKLFQSDIDDGWNNCEIIFSHVTTALCRKSVCCVLMKCLIIQEQRDLVFYNAACMLLCGRLIACVHTVEMTKWCTRHYRRDQQMKDKLYSTCVPSAGRWVYLLLLIW